ncbi:MAG: hypothetical protein A2166_01450 [Omnitrophica WOR_2 bacterium RBG_13_41_10]|nr:MAG: hypothetical protein A2166_01450 [Omnitrophica WOR_2 bacterium RBG_13_41_10]
MKSIISIVKCQDYDQQRVFQATKKALDLIGGINSFIKPQSKVLVKPNLLLAIEPETAVDTHPEVVRAVVKLLKEIQCHIYLGDGPNVWGNQIENLEGVYRRSGMKQICDEEGVELVNFDKRRWRKKFPLTTWLDHCDYLVSVPKFKTHSFTVFSGAIKNLFGLVCGTYKTELHKQYFKREDFSKMLVDILEEVKPALTVIDGIISLEGDGPGTSGKPRHTGLLFAGQDCVALDSILSVIMGLKADEILTTKEAAKRGLGISDIKAIELKGERLENVIQRLFKLPATSLKYRIPQPVVELAKKLIKYYPCVERDNCTKCASCIKACPTKAISMQKKGIAFNYKKCIACFCCQEACSNAAIKTKKSILAKIIGL